MLAVLVGAANAVPSELYDESTARTKVQNAEGGGDHVAQTEDRKLAGFIHDHLPELRARLAPLQ